MQRKILVFFLLHSISTALIISLIADKYANNVIIFKNLLFSLYLFLSIWIMVEKLNNYGLALLFSFISILILGIFHSFLVFLAVLVFLLVIFLYGLRNIRCAIRLSTCLNTFLIAVISIILALIAISGMARGYGDLWIDYRIMNAAVNIDTLFHVACANMINNYHTISTGLHGLPFWGYHVFSHFLYGNISNILNVFTYQVYGYTTFIVFIPLLFLSSMSFAEELTPSKNKFGLYISFLLLVSIFIGFLGRNAFVRYGLLWDSFFNSESYLISLIMLFAFLSYLLSAINKPTFFLSLLFLIVLFTSKISVGFMGFMLLIVCELFSGGDLKNLSGTEKPIQRLIIIFKKKICSRSLLKIAIYIFLFVCMGSFFIQFNNNQFKFEFIYIAKQYLNPSVIDQFGRLGSLIVFFFTHYFFVLLSILLFVMYYFFNRNSFDRLKKMFLFLIIATLAGFFPLCMPISGGGGYYFSNISMFFAIPIILSCKNYISKEAFTSNLRGIAVVTTLIVLYGMYGSLKYGTPYLKSEIGRLAELGRIVGIVGSSPVTPYIRQLKSIGENDGLKKFLVYIPKQETNFWGNSDSLLSKRRAFVIPVVSGRPALFGLPHAKRYGYGYDSYSKTLFNEADSDKISHERLCEETRRLGFEGYIMVSSSTYEIVKCKNQHE